MAVAVVLASLTQVIDRSLVNATLPDMTRTFGANLRERGPLGSRLVETE